MEKLFKEKWLKTFGFDIQLPTAQTKAMALAKKFYSLTDAKMYLIVKAIINGILPLKLLKSILRKKGEFLTFPCQDLIIRSAIKGEIPPIFLNMIILNDSVFSERGEKMAINAIIAGTLPTNLLFDMIDNLYPFYVENEIRLTQATVNGELPLQALKLMIRLRYNFTVTSLKLMANSDISYLQTIAREQITA